jgi:EpsI family protein
MSRGRAIGVVLLLMASAAIGRAAVTAPSGASHADLSALPYVIQAWRGTEGPPLDPDTLRILAADDVLNRTYMAADGTPIGLYVAYYAAQRPGVSIHSPLHCLPGTGWEALDVSTVGLPDAASGTMRRLIVRKDERRALVLYWYSLHGRMIAGEATSKFTLLFDSVRLRRSDAALVRIVVPIVGSVAAAEQHGLAFAGILAPRIADVLNVWPVS